MSHRVDDHVEAGSIGQRPTGVVVGTVCVGGAETAGQFLPARLRIDRDQLGRPGDAGTLQGT